MKNAASKIFLIIFVLLYLSACNNETQENHSISPPEDDVPSYESVNEESPVEGTAEVFYYLEQPHRIDASGWELSSYLQNYLNGDYFRELYRFGSYSPDEELYLAGVDLFFPELRPVSIELFGMGYYVGLSFQDWYKGEIVRGIRIGTPMEQIVADLGEPQFSNSEYSMIGYRTNLFAIAFIGEDFLERVYVQQEWVLPEEYHDILLDFEEDFKSARERYAELFPYHENSYFNEDGIYASRYGLATYFSGKTFFISPDYAGKVPSNSNVFRLNEVSNIETRILHHIEFDQYIDSLTEIGELSPNGQMVLYSHPNMSGNAFLYYLDHSVPYQIWEDHEPNHSQWISDRYLAEYGRYSYVYIYDLMEKSLVILPDGQEGFKNVSGYTIDFAEDTIYLQSGDAYLVRIDDAGEIFFVQEDADDQTE